MQLRFAGALLLPVLALAAASAQSADKCAALTGLKLPGVEIVSAKFLPAVDKTAAASPWEYSGPLPEHCRVEGVLSRRTGAGGEEFGIRFALAMPTGWNGDYVQQGGGGGNGTVALPVGATAAGDKPALLRGFAVASNDTGHKAHTGPFDFGFMRDQQAMLDFAFEANVRVAEVARQIVAAYYPKPAAYSYFLGCSTGGREGMILSQRFPAAFNGIVSGDPAMRTGLSNLAIGPWAESAWNRIAPKDAAGKPLAAQALTDADRKLVMDALLARCDARDGVADGMIFDPLGCDFSPSQLVCKPGETAGCLSAEKAAAIEHVFSGPKTSRGFQVYPGFLYDTGIADRGFAHGLLVPGPGPVLGAFTGTEFDVDEAVRTASDPLVEPLSTNLSTFSGRGGK
ncbi:MAG: tannase/feruloyl esterase family alpha/beta hydrolase, partial [Terracidiphilus sp.]